MYWIIFSYLAATAATLFLAQLIDFTLLFSLGFICYLGYQGYLLFFWQRQRKKGELFEKHRLTQSSRDFYSKLVLCLAVFFWGAAWSGLYAYIKINQVLPDDLESRDLIIEGRVIGLPKHEGYRQSFDFQPEFPHDCEAMQVGEKAAQQTETLCAVYFQRQFRLLERWYPLEFSEWLLTKSMFAHLLTLQTSKLKLSWYGKDQEAIKGGDRYRLLVKLKRPRSSINYNGFDYEGWLFSENYHAVGYVRSKGDNIKLPDEIFQGRKYLNLSAWRESLRHRLLGQVLLEGPLASLQNPPLATTQTASQSVSQTSALILALVLGDRSYLSSQTRDLLVQTGTAHLLAISGMHIGLLSLLTFFLVFQFLKVLNWLFTCLESLAVFRTRLTYSYRMRLYLAALMSMLVAVIYAFLAGFSLPTQRALIMVCCYSFTLMIFEKPDFFKTWCVALFLVLLWNPLAWLSSGLYLSFIAVLVIQWSLTGRPILTSKKFKKTRIMWRSQMAVFIGLAPVLMFIFSAFYPLALVLNLFAVPWVSFLVLPLCFLGVLLTAVDLVWAKFVFDWVEKLLNIFLILLESGLASAPSHLSNSLGVLGAAGLFVYTLCLLSPLSTRIKIVTLVFIFPLLIDFFGVLELKNEIPQGEFTLSVLDVGQGLALIVETQNHLLLYDTGPAFGENFDAGSAIVIPALTEKLKGRWRKNFTKQIDVLVLSHGDNDHIGGVQSILQKFRISQVWAYRREHNEGQQSQNYRYVAEQSALNWRECQRGIHWYWDTVKFEFLHPDADLSRVHARSNQRVFQNANNRSCVLKVTSPAWASSTSMLLPGDIEKSAEHDLLEQLAPEVLKSNILISPHHGSRSSSTAAFLKVVEPDLVLISAGYRSQFGHPHRDTLANYQHLNIPFFNTADTGEIRLKSWILDADEKYPALHFARKHRPRFWRLD